ncbi:alpha/beta hydrolase [bacterium]|nr:alpha/beta hydrolase [bacterium]
MKLWPYFAFLKDLIDILPSRTEKSWTEVENLLPNRPTVLLVSGFGATQRNLSVMRRRLKRDGFNVLVIALDWGSLSDGVRGYYRMAEQLAASVIALKKRPDLRNVPVFVVAHSAGGLVARYYIQVLGGFHYTEGLITLATPHRGSWVALLGFVTHLALKAMCLIQMLPVSRFVRRINRSRFPTGFPFLSISSPQDYLCRPAMAKLPKSFSKMETVQSVKVPDLSHSAFLHSKRVYALVLATLRQEVGAEFGTSPAPQPDPSPLAAASVGEAS